MVWAAEELSWIQGFLKLFVSHATSVNPISMVLCKLYVKCFIEFALYTYANLAILAANCVFYWSPGVSLGP